MPLACFLEEVTNGWCNQGFQLANSTDKTMFEFFEDHPERMSRFKDAMSFLQTLPGLEPSYAVKAYDWASLGKATVVDVGGSHGLVCIALANEFPELQFVVQDLPKVIEDAKAKSPPEPAHHVTFMAHDFFEEQSVKDAEVYYFRWILHDWSDKYCIKILRALIPALKTGARLLFSERCRARCRPARRSGIGTCHALSVYADVTDTNRDSDITMMATSNSLERDEEDWKALLAAADANFTLEEVRRTPGAKLDLIVVKWK